MPDTGDAILTTVRTSRLTKWIADHKWTSLICTIFLLILCVTGLPLIFHEEIDEWQHGAAMPVLAQGNAVDLDKTLASARAIRPKDAVQYLLWDAKEPSRLFVALAATPTAVDDVHVVTLDGRTAKTLGSENSGEGVVAFLLKLHTDMFLGLPGKLFLGVMGMLFVASIVSGIALYAPFMSKLAFGTVRRRRARRLYWLDLHNLLGAASLVWMLVVGVTGVINTWAELALGIWQYTELSDMTAPYKNLPPLDESTPLVSLTQTVATAKQAAPGMIPSFIAFPKTIFSSGYHYAVFMRGDTPLTARLLKPVLIDARTAAMTATRDLPWYVTMVLVAQPLHFGDYGGLPLKILWSAFDVVAIVMLGSGVYLWWGRRRRTWDMDFEPAGVPADLAGAPLSPEAAS